MKVVGDANGEGKTATPMKSIATMTAAPTGRADPDRRDQNPALRPVIDNVSIIESMPARQVHVRHPYYLKKPAITDGEAIP
jgi:hypothetical protein